VHSWRHGVADAFARAGEHQGRVVGGNESHTTGRVRHHGRVVEMAGTTVTTRKYREEVFVVAVAGVFHHGWIDIDGLPRELGELAPGSVALADGLRRPSLQMRNQNNPKPRPKKTD
jgi:hypothetical protein